MVLTLAQIQTVLASNALFARKFDVQIKESRHLLDIIDHRRAFYDEVAVEIASDLKCTVPYIT